MWALLLVHFAGIKAAGPVSHFVSGWVRRNVFQVLHEGMVHARSSLVSSLHTLSTGSPLIPKGRLSPLLVPRANLDLGPDVLRWLQLPPFACQSNPDLLPKSSWLGFCLLSWFPAPLTCFLLFPGFLVILPHASDRKPTALSPWPCYKGFLVHNIVFKGYTYTTHPVLRYADLSGSFLGTLRIETETESGKSRVTSGNAQMRSPQLFLLLKDWPCCHPSWDLAIQLCLLCELPQ